MGFPIINRVRDSAHHNIKGWFVHPTATVTRNKSGLRPAFSRNCLRLIWWASAGPRSGLTRESAYGNAATRSTCLRRSASRTFCLTLPPGLVKANAQVAFLPAKSPAAIYAGQLSKLDCSTGEMTPARCPILRTRCSRKTGEPGARTVRVISFLRLAFM